MVSYQIIRPVKLPYVSACQLLPKNKTEKGKKKKNDNVSNDAKPL